MLQTPALTLTHTHPHTQNVLHNIKDPASNAMWMIVWNSARILCRCHVQLLCWNKNIEYPTGFLLLHFNLCKPHNYRLLFPPRHGTKSGTYNPPAHLPGKRVIMRFCFWWRWFRRWRPPPSCGLFFVVVGCAVCCCLLYGKNFVKALCCSKIGVFKFHPELLFWFFWSACCW